MVGERRQSTGGGSQIGDVLHAPKGFATSLALFVLAIVAVALYLIVVRGEALFVDLAALSGMLFCF